MEAAKRSILPALVLILSVAGCREVRNPVAAPLADEPPAPQAVTANVVASDASSPTGPAGAPVSVSGTVTLNGLQVRLWDGQAWLTVTTAAPSATIAVGNGLAPVTLMSASEIPAGQYQKVRLSATEVLGTLALTVNGRDLGAEFWIQPGEGEVPPEIEKPVEVMRNPDGTLTIEVTLEMIRTIVVNVDPGAGATVTIDGDLVTATAPVTTR